MAQAFNLVNYEQKYLDERPCAINKAVETDRTNPHIPQRVKKVNTYKHFHLV